MRCDGHHWFHTPTVLPTRFFFDSMVCVSEVWAKTNIKSNGISHGTRISSVLFYFPLFVHKSSARFMAEYDTMPRCQKFVAQDTGPDRFRLLWASGPYPIAHTRVERKGVVQFNFTILHIFVLIFQYIWLRRPSPLLRPLATICDGLTNVFVRMRNSIQKRWSNFSSMLPISNRYTSGYSWNMPTLASEAITKRWLQCLPNDGYRIQ